MMTEPLHPWWATFGETVDPQGITAGPAEDMLRYLQGRNTAETRLIKVRQTDEATAILLEIEVERPQDLAVDIRGREPIALLFSERDLPPSVLALREDFPDTMHQNWCPADSPASLCVDDRPWAEARLTYSPAELLRRVMLWLAKAARGELHDPTQPLDPHFFRSSLGIVIPVAALTGPPPLPELAGWWRRESPQMVITEPSRPGSPIAFVTLVFSTGAQAMHGRIRHAPTDLAGLARELAPFGIDFLSDVTAKLRDLAGLTGDDAARLQARLAIVVDFPVAGPGGTVISDPRAFVTHESVGHVGEELAVLHRNESETGDNAGYVRLIGEPDLEAASKVQIEPVNVYLQFDRNLAAAISGSRSNDLRKVVLVGAGSLGSQLALDLAREGRFRWTIIDNDILLPHNLARHALMPEDVAAPKATILAQKVEQLLGEEVTAIPANVLDPEEKAAEIAQALNEADVIIDASASVAVSRWLSDHDSEARRVAAFFNPAGTDVVLLAEDASRGITLRQLEAAYHERVQTEPDLQGHLSAGADGVRYSGSCRSLTSRIPASRAAMLSALAAIGVIETLQNPTSSVRIWRYQDDGGVRMLSFNPVQSRTMRGAGWIVSCAETVVDQLKAIRRRELPRETGGVLMGIIDMAAHSIHVVSVLEPPVDSRGTVTSFERGIVGLAETVRRAGEASLEQLRYVGEWHSHPRHSSSRPSNTDLDQLNWLTLELQEEGIPAVMAIVAEEDDVRILMGISGALPSLELKRTGSD